MVRRAFPLTIQLENGTHRVQHDRWFSYVALLQTSSLAPGLFKGETAFTQVSHNLPYLARWLPTHMAVNKFSRGRFQAESDLRWVSVASMSTDVRVNCCPWNCHIDTLHSYSGGSAMSHLTLALGQLKTLKQHLS